MKILTRVVWLASFLPSFSFSQATASETQVTAIFQYPEHPVSLLASVVSMGTVTGDPINNGDIVITYQVDCPAATASNNDACRAASIYPAIAYHTQGSIFGGTITASAAGATTTWRCELGNCAGCTPELDGTCVNTIVGPGMTSRVETTSINSCFVMAHSVPAIITAGAEKLSTDRPKPSLGVEGYLSAFASDLSMMGCPVSETGGFGNSSSTMTMVSATTGSIKGNSMPTIGMTASQEGLSASSTSSSPNSTGKSGSARVIKKSVLNLGLGMIITTLSYIIL